MIRIKWHKSVFFNISNCSRGIWQGSVAWHILCPVCFSGPVSAFCLFNHKKSQSETHLPTAEAEAWAGEVLIWKEWITGHVLIWNIATEALAQGLKEGDSDRRLWNFIVCMEVSSLQTEDRIRRKWNAPSFSLSSLPAEPCRWRWQSVVSGWCCCPAAAPGCAADRWSLWEGYRFEFRGTGWSWRLPGTNRASWNAPGEDGRPTRWVCLKIKNNAVRGDLFLSRSNLDISVHAPDPSSLVWTVSWKMITPGPRVDSGTSRPQRVVVAFSSLVKCLRYASDASPRNLNRSSCRRSAWVL